MPSVLCQIARGMRGARVCQPCQPLSHEKKDSVVAALLPWQAHRKCSAARSPTGSSVEAPLGPRINIAANGRHPCTRAGPLISFKHLEDCLFRLWLLPSSCAARIERSQNSRSRQQERREDQLPLSGPSFPMARRSARLRDILAVLLRE